MNTTRGLKRIGKGAFSTVYRETETTVLIVSDDPVKECMSLGWFPNSPLFPKVERLECDFDSNGCSLYRMAFFPRHRSLKNSLKPRQWDLYKTLNRYFNTVLPPYRKGESFEVLKQCFEHCLKFYLIEKEALLEAVDALASYGSDMWFEISPRNVAVKDGELIFLDCFFMREHLKRS